MEIPAIDVLAILAAFTLGVVTKYLDDLRDWHKAVVALLIATIPMAIAAYTTPEIYLGTLVGVYMAGKIDTKILSLYFVYLIAVMLLVDILYDIKIRLLPLIAFTFAAALDEKEKTIFGVERLILPLTTLAFVFSGLLLEFFDISVGALDPQALFDVGFKSFIYLLAFDIGYRITAWLIEPTQ